MGQNPHSFFNGIERKRKYSSLCSIWNQSTILWVPCCGRDTHTDVHTGKHTHTHRAHVCVLSTELHVVLFHTVGHGQKSMKTTGSAQGHTCGNFPREKTEENVNLPLEIKHTHRLTGLCNSHLEDTASQSWPSPLGRWPVRPATEGRGLLLPGEGFWEWWITLASWQ